MDGRISLPYCMTFLFCAFTVYSDLETMGNSAFLSKKINTELDRLEEVTNIPKMDTITDKLNPANYEISLKDVSFGYGSRKIIENISLNIPEHTMQPNRPFLGCSGRFCLHWWTKCEKLYC